MLVVEEAEEVAVVEVVAEEEVAEGVAAEEEVVEVDGKETFSMTAWILYRRTIPIFVC